MIPTEKVKVGYLVKKLDFQDQDAARAASEQPLLYYRAGQNRLYWMRLKNKRKARLLLLEVELKKGLREQAEKKQRKITPAELKERLAELPEIIELRERVSRATEEEEMAKVLVKAYELRGSALKVVGDHSRAEDFRSGKDRQRLKQFLGRKEA